MRNRHSLAAVCLVLLALGGCDAASRSARVIHLPEGDPDRGKVHFIELGCVNCHTIVAAELPDRDGPVRVVLGTSGRVKSYGDLVTSIVNPSHRISGGYRRDKVTTDGESLMPSYNDVMTVSQLTDLVAFLQQYYQRISRPRYQYRRYDEDTAPSAERLRSTGGEQD